MAKGCGVRRRASHAASGPSGTPKVAGGGAGMVRPPLELAREARALGRHRGRQEVERRFAVLEDRGVEIDEVANALGHAVGRAGDDWPGETVADQHHGGELLGVEHIDEVGNEGFECDSRRKQVTALAEPGLCRREDAMALGAERIGDARPAPAAVKGPMQQDETALRHPLAPALGAAPSMAPGAGPRQGRVAARSLARR